MCVCVSVPACACACLWACASGTQVPNKFRVRCRVIGTWPEVVEEVSVPVAPRATPSGDGGVLVSDSQPRWRYLFTLCLDDGTGSLVAIVTDDDAVSGAVAHLSVARGRAEKWRCAVETRGGWCLGFIPAMPPPSRCLPDHVIARHPTG